ncbi:MAG: radical SAM protein [Phycisphaerae bacterium]|nr:radical SAM protein [Phycisphaerae bacterium]
MANTVTIIDCYTDEPAGLGVPPYLGVHPRYVAGSFDDVPNYLTIDDLRLANWNGRIDDNTFDPLGYKTRKNIVNRTRSIDEINHILENTEQIIIIAGIQTPGKYMSAVPGTLAEVKNLLKGHRYYRCLAGPAAICGTQLQGGQAAETAAETDYDEFWPKLFDDYDELQDYAIDGADIFKQIPQKRTIEIETGRGCSREVGCSFCTEPMKSVQQWRNTSDIIAEIKRFKELGANWFRLGKQACIFSYQGGCETEIENLLKGIAEINPELLHIDNVNPMMVNEERTRLFVKYLTAGSTAAMGIESFDPYVCETNNLNTTPDSAMDAIKLINRIGGVRGDNGNFALLPGINLLLGLENETAETLEMNYNALKRIYDDGLMIRRINIRQVVPFPGTKLFLEAGTRFLRKNRKHYDYWTKKIRNEIDGPMLERLYPAGTILRGLYSEVHDDQVTYLRQPGSYPIIVAVNKYLPLNQCFDIEVRSHHLRHLEGGVV